MNETSKMYNIRKKRGDFNKYLKGKGLDIGCGGDKLKLEAGTVTGINIDGEYLEKFRDEEFDFVYSSHCLEHLQDIELAVKNWSRVLKKGGFMYAVVPDWVIYEKKIWPSLFNGDHKHTFSLGYTRDMVGRDNHWHIYNDLEKIFNKYGLELLDSRLEDYGYDYSKPDIDQTFTTDHAVCQICIIAEKKHSITTKRIPYIEFGGGLGDIINQMFRTTNYRYFETITERTMALLICHNPYATEIFKYHPKKDLIEVRLEPWSHPREAETKIRKPLCSEGYFRRKPLMRQNVGIKIYSSLEDKKLLESIEGKYAVIQPYAGTRERDVPAGIINTTSKYLADKYNLKSVIIGRSYIRERANHSEEIGAIFDSNENVINMIDTLTVPGTIEAVSNCALFFGSHSSMNIAAWHYKKPCVVLYDEETRKRHFQRTDEWSFGKDFKDTRHGFFGEFSVKMIDEVLSQE